MNDEISKVFSFAHKNSSAVIYLSAVNYTDARENLHDLVEDSEAWRCDDEEGVDDD